MSCVKFIFLHSREKLSWRHTNFCMNTIMNRAVTSERVGGMVYFLDVGGQNGPCSVSDGLVFRKNF